MSCGDEHTVVMMASGEVCTFGNGDYGRLGHGEHGHVEGDLEGTLPNVLVPRVVAGICV